MTNEKEVKRAAKMLYNALWAPIYLAEQPDADETTLLLHYLDLRNLLLETFPDLEDKNKRKRNRALSQTRTTEAVR